MLAQLEQPHAFSQAKAPQLASDCVLLQSGGDGFSRHVGDRFRVAAVCALILSSEETHLPCVLHNKTVFL
jgi:hypothetical protein